MAARTAGFADLCPPRRHVEGAVLRERAGRSHEVVVDLSIGSPVDPTPEVARRALAEHTDAPGYPLAVGRPGLREAYVNWLRRCHGVVGIEPTQTLLTIGSKEFIGGLPQLVLGSGRPGPVAIPALAYPTYVLGASLAARDVVRVDGVDDLRALAKPPALLWVNSPGNPTGRVLSPDTLADLVTLCRERGTLLVSDECYLDLGWEAQPVSVLHPEVCGGLVEGLLAVHSLSKRSNLAGYRCGFVAGDAALVAPLVAVRRELGLTLPEPQQAVAVAVLGDEAHVVEQRARYSARRDTFRPALAAAGFRVDHSEAGLYLWVTRDEASDETAGWFADRGIIVVDGASYGPTGDRHVRLSLTVTDEAIATVVARLTR